MVYFRPFFCLSDKSLKFVTIYIFFFFPILFYDLKIRASRNASIIRIVKCRIYNEIERDSYKKEGNGQIFFFFLKKMFLLKVVILTAAP